MTEEKDRRNMGEIRHEYYEDEINLFDYILVLWKWKWLIVLGTLVSVIVAIVITLRMPEIYRVSMDIEPGVVGLNDKGNKLYMDSKEIIGKINGGKYNVAIGKSLSKPPANSSLAFTAKADKYSNLITVESQWAKSDLDVGLGASGILGLLLIEDHKEGVEKTRKDKDALIEIEKEQIEGAKKAKENIVKTYIGINLKQLEIAKESITLQKQILEETRTRLRDLTVDLKKSKGALEDMIEQRSWFLKNGRKKGDVSLHDYEVAIQTGQLRVDQSEEKIFSAKIKKQEVLSEIRRQYLEIKHNNELLEDIKVKQTDQLQQTVKILKEEIENLSAIRTAISNIQVVRQPEAASAPVKSSKGKKIILLSGVVALFMFIFLAFFIEYIRNARREYGARKGQA